MRAIIRLTAAAAGALLGSMALAVTAFGHAELLRTEPRHGQVLERPPRAVVLTFNESIDPGLVQLQVSDKDGRRVDRGETFHPGGREEVLAVRLPPRLAGRFVARFRVISEDGHPVVKRLSFRVPPKPADDEAAQPGAAPAPEEDAPGPAPMPEEEGEHIDAAAGDVTDVSFAATRAVGYLAIALTIGGALFIFVAWLPALAQVATSSSEWMDVSATFGRRLRQILLGAVAVGLLATAMAIVLEAATAVGVSFWSALDPDVVDSVSETRPVRAWILRILVWLVLGVALLVTLRPHRLPAMRRAALGADGMAIGPAPSRIQLLVLLGAAIGLALTAPLAGHAGGHSPRRAVVHRHAARAVHERVAGWPRHAPDRARDRCAQAAAARPDSAHGRRGRPLLVDGQDRRRPAAADRRDPVACAGRVVPGPGRHRLRAARAREDRAVRLADRARRVQPAVGAAAAAAAGSRRR